MFNRFFLIMFFCVSVVSISACGGGTNILNVQSTFTTATTNAPLESVTRTIITASAVKGWKPEVAGPGHIIATRRRSGHVAKVDITYTSDSFNINYLDSDNLEYDGKTISSVYSQWVNELRDEIKRRLSEL